MPKPRTSFLDKFKTKRNNRVKDGEASFGADEINISVPTDVEHNIHVHVDPQTGKLAGIPKGWEKYVGSSIRWERKVNS